MISDVEDYFASGCGRCDRFGTADCSTRHWAEGLTALRRICLDQGLDETVRWGHPCYRHADRNIAIIGAFRDDFRLSFMNAALMTDPEGVLQGRGPNTRHPDMIRFTGPEQVAGLATTIRAYLRESMGYAEAGVKPPKTEHDIELPDEMIEALESDPELAEAFRALTPGRQRSYQIVISAAKSSATRVSRIAKLRPHILAGKGATER